MDGTFQFCTKFFCQMFTIQAFRNGYYISVVFCLLPDKRTVTYAELFKKIIERCESDEFVFKHSKIVIDFEQAIHSACSLVWPETEITGCRFHLCQSWYRKIQSLGLVSDYKNKNSDVGAFLRLFFGMHYLEAVEIGDFFSDELYSQIPLDHRVTQFCDYVVENYIDDESIFPPSMWTSTTDSMHRTTNSCESFHNKFNSNFYSSHPNIFAF
jgi:hypothetical protein